MTFDSHISGFFEKLDEITFFYKLSVLDFDSSCWHDCHREASSVLKRLYTSLPEVIIRPSQNGVICPLFSQLRSILSQALQSGSF
jgi:hypothetical protein